MIVYKITNKINNKVYIGQTIISIRKRWTSHCSLSKSVHRSAIRSAIQKYGKDNFEIKVIAKCNSIDELNHREKYYISLFKSLAPNGYNLESGGNLKKTVSLETRAKISKASKLSNLGKIRTAEMKVNYSLSKTGCKNPNFGKPSPKRGTKTGTPSPMARKVIDISTGQIWPSIEEAAKANNRGTVTIWRKLIGQRPNHTNLRLVDNPD